MRRVSGQDTGHAEGVCRVDPSVCVALAVWRVRSRRIAAVAETIERAYTPFDVDKVPAHGPAREVEDYGSWLCAGHGGIAVRADRRRSAHAISATARDAAQRAGRAQTLAGVQQRGQDHRMADRAFAERQAARRSPPSCAGTAVTTDDPKDEDGNRSRGQVLVVTRLGRAASAMSAMSTAAPIRMRTNSRARSPTSMRAASSAARTSPSCSARARVQRPVWPAIKHSPANGRGSIEI